MERVDANESASRHAEGGDAGSGVREVYRVPYRDLADHDLSIVLETGDGERFDAEIIDLSIKGVGTRFEGQMPILALRDEVTIEIQVSGSGDPTRISAILRSQFKAAGWCRYGFEFSGGRLPARGLASRIYGWFNRRGSPRATVTDLPIEVSVERSRAAALKGRMVDLCSGGASVEVAGDEPGALAEGESTTIHFTLAEGEPRISLHAQVRRRESNGRALIVGLQFEGPYEPNAKDRVDRFVVERLLSSEP